MSLIMVDICEVALQLYVSVYRGQHCNVIVSTSDPHSESHKLKFQSRDRLSLMKILIVFFSSA
jgi:hypothetical protein